MAFLVEECASCIAEFALTGNMIIPVTTIAGLSLLASDF